MRPETLDFKGSLLLDAKISQTQTGIKSVLLKLIDPLFKKKHGSGSAIPIKIVRHPQGAVVRPRYPPGVPSLAPVTTSCNASPGLMSVSSDRCGSFASRSRRPYTFVVLALLILMVGPLTIARTPTDIFPNIDIPVVAVVWNYGGLSAEEMSTRIVVDLRARR